MSGERLQDHWSSGLPMPAYAMTQVHTTRLGCVILVAVFTSYEIILVMRILKHNILARAL